MDTIISLLEALIQWDYPQQLDRYIGELHGLGGSLSANQRLSDLR